MEKVETLDGLVDLVDNGVSSNAALSGTARQFSIRVSWLFFDSGVAKQWKRKNISLPAPSGLGRLHSKRWWRTCAPRTGLVLALDDLGIVGRRAIEFGGAVNASSQHRTDGVEGDQPPPGAAPPLPPPFTPPFGFPLSPFQDLVVNVEVSLAIRRSCTTAASPCSCTATWRVGWAIRRLCGMATERRIRRQRGAADPEPRRVLHKSPGRRRLKMCAAGQG